MTQARSGWRPFIAEACKTASQATWGVWILTVIVLVLLLGALAVAAWQTIT
jgi:hypothetical protein